MDKISINKDFNLNKGFPSLSYEFVGKVLREFGKEIKSSGLYKINNLDSSGSTRFGTFFNGEQYAEIDYFNNVNDSSKGLISISVYGKGQLELIKKRIENGLEELTKNA